ncbi:hypothetical protein EC991_006250 [Linnemannia zychae]|nr:hypothetical protein EC991_006250 [Linnemannia zychae]
MTSTCASSEVADSFEDLSSLSSDKDIESLILATTYDDDDLSVYNNNNSTSDISCSGYDAEGTDTKLEANEAVEVAGKEVDVHEDDDFVDLRIDDEEDEVDVFSEGWESPHSASPEPQQNDRQDRPSSSPLPLENNLGQMSLSDIPQFKNTVTASSQKNMDTEMAMDNPVKSTRASKLNSSTVVMIPKIRMSKDIFAAVRKPILTTISSSTTPPSATAAPSPALQRANATPSRIRATRIQFPKRNVASFIPTPNNGTPLSSPSSPGNKRSPALKKPSVFATPSQIMLTASAITTTLTPIEVVDTSVMAPSPSSAAAPENVQAP